jgi:exopolysaccharide biosynthesis polyprenyl glycosylphosphotransferase
MAPLRRQILLNILKIYDLAVMIGCLIFAARITSPPPGSALPFEDLLATRVKLLNILILLFFLAAWHGIFSFFRLYRSRRLTSLYEEVADPASASGVGTILLFTLSGLFHLPFVTHFFLFVFWVSASASTAITRLLLRFFMREARLHGRNLRHLLVVGTNDRIVNLVQTIEARPDLGYCIVGFVDTKPQSHQFDVRHYSLVSNFTQFPDFIRENVVDEVVIGLPIKSFYQQIGNIIAVCGEQGVTVRLLSDLFDLKLGRSRAGYLGDQVVVTISSGGVRGLPGAAKRLFDIYLSLFLLVLFLPVFALVALLIKAISPGPVLFVQKRVGLNKRRFSLYKFRTMVADAEEKLTDLQDLNEVTGPVFKMKSDPRVTPIGRFLRRTSLDELPQIVNVLKGDMSLVGPRPLPLRDYKGFDEDWHRRRFSVRPGITCLWQVNGRSNVSFDKWMELDMKYIDNWSFWLDLKILARTIPAVLRGSGAA